MKIRSPLLIATAVAVLAASAFVAAPAVSDRIARHLEGRLARETGWEWRIGALGLSLSPGPGVILGELTAEGGAGARLTARTARLSGPVALLFDGAGTAVAVAEGVSLMAPLGAGAAVALPGATGVSALRARIDGAALDLSENGSAIAASMKTASVSIDLAPGAALSRAEIDLRGEGHALAIALDPPTAAGPAEARAVRLTLDPSSPGGRSARLSATLSAEPGAWRIDGVSGAIDGARVSGSARIALSRRPVLNLDLSIDALALRDAASSARDAAGPGLVIPLDALPDPRLLQRLDAEATLRVARLGLGPARLDGVTIAAAVAQGKLAATLDAASAYEGAVAARYGLEPTGGASESGRHSLSLTLTRSRARPLLKDVAAIEGIDGRVSARIALDATGARPADLLRSAAGSADLELVDGRIDTLDLAGWGAARGEGGGLRVAFLGGRLAIADGRAVTSDLRLTSPLVAAKGAGWLSLTDRTLDLTFAPSIARPRDGRPPAGSALSVPVRVTGSWDAPSVSADMSGLLRDPGAAAEALQNLGRGLLDGDGADLGGLLDGFLRRPERAAPPPRRR